MGMNDPVYQADVMQIDVTYAFKAIIISNVIPVIDL